MATQQDFLQNQCISIVLAKDSVRILKTLYITGRIVKKAIHTGFRRDQIRQSTAL